QLCELAIRRPPDGPLTASNHIDTLGAQVSIRMVTSSRDPVRTRERIRRAARREFVAKGFAGARVDAIARSAAVNKRMLYHYFGDKEALYRAVLREGIATNLDLVAAAPADPDAEFQQRQARFLRCLGTHLRPPSLAAKVVRASQSKEKHR